MEMTVKLFHHPRAAPVAFYQMLKFFMKNVESATFFLHMEDSLISFCIIRVMADFDL